MAAFGRGPNDLKGVTADDQNNAQLVLFNLTGVDAGPLDTGATALGSVQANAYQIVAGCTWFTAGAVGAGCMLPETSAAPGGFLQGLRGLQVFIINTGPNYIACYPHVNDVGAQINLSASVTLQPNSINVFNCASPGNWFVDGIGAGFAGSIETVASQGNITAHSGGGQASGTPVTQAMANISVVAAGGDSVTLPPAKAGLQIVLNNSGANSANVFPASQGQGGATGGDQINALGQNAAFALTNVAAVPTVFYCFVAGTWLTK